MEKKNNLLTVKKENNKDDESFNSNSNSTNIEAGIKVKVNYNKENIKIEKKTTDFNQLIKAQKLINDEKNKNIFIEELNDFYEIIEIGEKDKILMDCYEYLKKTNNLEEDKKIELNDQISFEIKEINPFYIIRMKEEEIMLDKYARIINFVDVNKRTITKKFIYNSQNLNDYLRKIEFKSFYIKFPCNKEQNINNINSEINEQNESSTESSEISEISLGDSLSIFTNEKIIYIFNENMNPILTKKNFINKYPEKLSKLKDLNRNAIYYYEKYKDANFKKLGDYTNAIRNFTDFKDSSFSKILYLYGPNGCSKTTLLLYIAYVFKSLKTQTLYFNYDYLNNMDLVQRKRRIYHELIYFCKNEDEVYKFSSKKIFNGIEDKLNLMELIYYLLKVILDVVGDKIDHSRIIIIDNIYDNKKEVTDFLDNIIQLIKKKNKFFKLIICGKGKYFNDKLIELYFEKKVIENESSLKNAIKNEIVYLYQTKNDEIQKIFNENKDKLKENMEISEQDMFLKEENSISKYSFKNLFFSDSLDDKGISKEEIQKDKDFLTGMPLEYFVVTKTEEKLKFNFYSKLYKKVIKNKIGVEVEKNTLTKLLKNNEYPRTFFGICFEKLITLLLKHNKLNINNLMFSKDNIVEIKEITLLKKDPYSGPKFKYKNIDKPILILQENFYGPFYDLIVITKQYNSYYTDFIQIGVDKNNAQIEAIINDLENSRSIYKKNISNAFGIDENSIFISVLFIFDYDTQWKNNYSCGTNICIKKMINFYLFSFNYCGLYKFKNNKNRELTRINYYYPTSLLIEDDAYFNPKNIKKRGKNDSYSDKKITEFFKKEDETNK